MFDDPPIIRPAGLDDIADVHAIYAHYVTTSVATFELVPPDVIEMRRRFETITAAHFPFLVAEAGGKIMGFAYASTYRARAGYNPTVEDSVYVSPEYLRRGVGHALLEQLIDTCTERGFRRMVAVIGDSANRPSIALHQALGFVEAGILPSAGFKLGRWVDTVRMQRPLGSGDKTPPQ